MPVSRIVVRYVQKLTLSVGWILFQWQSVAVSMDWHQCIWVSCLFRSFTDNPCIISGRRVPTSWLFWWWSVQPTELTSFLSSGLVSGTHYLRDLILSIDILKCCPRLGRINCFRITGRHALRLISRTGKRVWWCPL